MAAGSAGVPPNAEYFLPWERRRLGGPCVERGGKRQILHILSPKRGIQRAASETVAFPGCHGSKKYAALGVPPARLKNGRDIDSKSFAGETPAVPAKICSIRRNGAAPRREITHLLTVGQPLTLGAISLSALRA